MDNIQDPVQEDPKGQSEPTGEQVPNVQPEGTNSGQQEGPEGTTFADVAAKKGFKSPDDLAKAYENLESHSTRVTQEKARLEREFFQAQEQPKERQPEERPHVAETENQALNELDRFVKERTKSEVQQIRAEFREKESRRELRETIEKNPDFSKYAQDVKEIKRQYPDMSFQDSLLLAKAQRGDSGVKVQLQVRAQGSQVAPTKPTSEKRSTAEELLAGQKNWKPHPMGTVDPGAVSEIEQIERELFGRVLKKTELGL